MNPSAEAATMHKVLAVLRVTLGVIILVTWFDNLQKGVYTAEGITGLFNYIFNDVGGGSAFYRGIVESTILQTPGLFAAFQMIAELLMGLGLLFGFLTPLVGLGALLFFANLTLAFWGGSEWIWTYVLLTSAAFTVAFTRAGREAGVDGWLLAKRGEPPFWLLR